MALNMNLGINIMKFEKGDVVFFSNNNIISWLIEWGTNGQTSHVGIMITDEIMGEFVNPRYKERNIKDVIKDKNNHIFVGKLSKTNREIFKKNEYRFDELIKQSKNKEYDFPQLLTITLSQFFTFIKFKKDTKKYFCSEFATECFIVTNILKDIIPSKISPDNLLDMFKNKEFGKVFIL